MTNRDISIKLKKPITEVEHWFRNDKYFNVPDPYIWDSLKSILGITTTEFDAQITEFEERDGVFEKSNRAYHEDGICPTLTTIKESVKVIVDG